MDFASVVGVDMLVGYSRSQKALECFSCIFGVFVAGRKSLQPVRGFALYYGNVFVVVAGRVVFV